MSVVIETTLGDITVDLLLADRPKACLNFLKLCKMKYYNYNLFHTLSRGFIAQTGDPTGTRSGGESIFGVIEGPEKRYFEAENEPRIKHTRPGLISFVGDEDHMIASQFFLTLGDDLTYLDEKHCVFGEVVEGFDVLETINEVICDRDDRPYQDVRITHTVVLDDPYPDPKGLRIPSRSPSPSVERLAGGRIAPDEEIDETLGKTSKEIVEMQAEREAKARATILEMVGDIPDADMAPPENVLFVCKLNPVTSDDDLEIIFSRFGKIKSCEVIRDKKSGDSLQYAFIEFEEQKACEDAYFKMDNVLVDDRRIHVDFSQSVSKVKWHGKGRGVTHFDGDGNKRKGDMNNEIGKGDYKIKNGSGYKDNKKESERKSRSPRRHKERNSSPKTPEDVKEKRKSRSPKRKQTSQSPERRTKDRSPTWNRRKSRSPKHWRNRSRSPVRRRNDNRSPARSPPRRYDRRRWSRSPRYNWRRNERRYSPKRNSSSFISKSRSNRRSVWSPYQSKRNTTRRNSGSPKRRSTSHTSRSPSPSRKGTDMWEKANQLLKGKESKLSTLTDLSKIEIRRQRISSQRSISPGRTLESPRKRSESPINVLMTQRNSKGLQGEQNSPKHSKDIGNVSSSNNTSQSPRRSHSRLLEENTKTEERYLKTEIKKLTSAIGGNKHGKEKLSSENRVLTEKVRSKDKVKKTKKFSKKKKSKKYDSSEESDTDSEDRRKSKRKKSKKKVESSSDSSSSEESTSSSDEEMVKKKGSKKRSKKKIRDKKSKKSKQRKSSSSSSTDSSSDSESSNSSTTSSTSSSSESEKDNYKKKKLKKIQKTKNNSESD